MTDYKNRNHYHLEETENLIEEAKYNPNAELAIVLAERLEATLTEEEDDQ